MLGGATIVGGGGTERILRRFLFGTILGSLLLTLACGPGTTSETDGTPTPEPTPADFAAIRDVDFTALPETEALLQRLASGRAVEAEVLYTDLTGDLQEEAVVPVTSDGTQGNIAYLVYTMDSGKPALILTRTLDRTTAGGLVMDTDDAGALLETAAVYGAEDPLCCPSQLRLTTFRWDGTVLQVAGEMKVDQPDSAKQ
jgi:hypothetical protein